MDSRGNGRPCWEGFYVYLIWWLFWILFFFLLSSSMTLQLTAKVWAWFRCNLINIIWWTICRKQLRPLLIFLSIFFFVLRFSGWTPCLNNKVWLILITFTWNLPPEGRRLIHFSSYVWTKYIFDNQLYPYLFWRSCRSLWNHLLHLIKWTVQGVMKFMGFPYK